MKILFYLLVTASSLLASEKGRSVWAVAVGDPPVAKLKVVEEYGFRGYKPEEISRDLIFPSEWALSGSGGRHDFTLKLNHPATHLELPLGATSLQLGFSEQPQLASVTLPEEPALIVIFKPDPEDSWKDGARAMVIPLSQRAGSGLETTLVNLASVPLQYLTQAGKPSPLPPLKWTQARVPQEGARGVSSLPLLARAAAQEARLVVTEYRGSSRWNPVTLVTPVLNAARPRLRSLVLYLRE